MRHFCESCFSQLKTASTTKEQNTILRTFLTQCCTFCSKRCKPCFSNLLKMLSECNCDLGFVLKWNIQFGHWMKYFLLFSVLYMYRKWTSDILRRSQFFFTLLSRVKWWKLGQIFILFSEYLNFTETNLFLYVEKTQLWNWRYAY